MEDDGGKQAKSLLNLMVDKLIEIEHTVLMHG